MSRARPDEHLDERLDERAAEAAAAAKLADIIGQGAAGAELARVLAAEGVRGRAGLRVPAVLARLPRASQSSVLFSPQRRVPLAAAEAAAAEVIRRVRFRLSDDSPALRLEVILVGSARREAPRVKDIDFLVVVPPEHLAHIDGILGAAFLKPEAAAVTARARRPEIEIADNYVSGARRRSFILRVRAPGQRARKCYRADFFLTTETEKPYALFHYTGPVEFNIRTRAHVKRKGWLLNQYGVFDVATGRKIRGSTQIRNERELSAFLGVTYEPPTARE
jgi:DNA polymerase/3'-5' exonuclease PolX